MRFDVVSVPGHSPGHVAYAIDGALLSGDVLFAGSVGRTDLPGADWETLLTSLRLLVDRFPARPSSIPVTARRRRSATSSHATRSSRTSGASAREAAG